MNQTIRFDDEIWRPQLDNALAEGVSFELPPLKRASRFGVMLWWPSDQETKNWVHPDDLETVAQMVPGNRILKRTDISNSDYAEFAYGATSFRVRPSIWLEVTCAPYEIGDLVETRSQMGRRRAVTARIEERLWNSKSQTALFRLSTNGTPLPQLYPADAFQMVVKLNQPKDWRTIQLIENAVVR